MHVRVACRLEGLVRGGWLVPVGPRIEFTFELNFMLVVAYLCQSLTLFSHVGNSPVCIYMLLYVSFYGFIHSFRVQR